MTRAIRVLHRFCIVTAGHPRFHALVITVIGLNAVVIGLETVPSIMASAGDWLRMVDRAVIAFFVVELTIRLLAEWPRPLRFFASGWNVFDAVVVAASLAPQVGSFASVARLARVLRVARLVSTVPELRLIVGTMLRSVRSMGHVVLLLALLLYVYGIIGHHLFRDVDPDHWGSLGAAIGTLFQILTLEGWVEIQARSAVAVPFAWVFYGSFIVVAVFVVINLFIAVVINNLEATKVELATAAPVDTPETDLRRQAQELRRRLEQFEAALATQPSPRPLPPEGRPVARPVS